MNRLKILLFLLFASQVQTVEATTDIYLSTLRQFYAEMPALCLGVPPFPVPVKAVHSVWERGRLLALVDAGLAEIKQQRQVKYFSLTPTGQASQHHNLDLCYGRFDVHRIIETVATDNNNITIVYFTYHLVQLREWAKHPAMRLAFTEMDNLVNGDKKMLYRATLLTGEKGQLKLLDLPQPDGLEY